jgi:FADH2 O2-dependent halogenase
VHAVELSSPSVNQPIRRFDFLIAGSGFSGSLLAWILASQGRSVLLIDRSRHPRFAVGESSTPTADFLLAYLAERWGLKQLAPLACWGQWKKHYPHVVCGKKRGFSYYHHSHGKEVDPSSLETQSLLVAASSQDAWSDTHWLRSSVDEFLANQACSAGATLIESTQIHSALFDPFEHRWSISLRSANETPGADIQVQATWLIDATGHQGLSSIGIDNPEDSHWMRTRTGAVYGHFVGVDPFTQAAIPSDPFCGDDAAQHHVLDTGWIWMLRFDNGVTSVGLVEPTSAVRSQDHFWKTVQSHPSLARLMRNAKLVAPIGLKHPATCSEPVMACVDRMSRCRTRACGPGWVSLPVSYGFIDPLHSTGIAHSISGVVRLAEAMLSNNQACYGALKDYGEDLRRELQWLDLLVAGCYLGQPSFENFVAFACMYFISAIEFEKQLAIDPARWPKGFLQSKDFELANVANQAYEGLRRVASGDWRGEEFGRQVRLWIEPWNRIGLLDPSYANRIAHSVAPKYASSLEALCLDL